MESYSLTVQLQQSLLPFLVIPELSLSSLDLFTTISKAYDNSYSSRALREQQKHYTSKSAAAKPQSHHRSSQIFISLLGWLVREQDYNNGLTILKCLPYIRFCSLSLYIYIVQFIHVCVYVYLYIHTSYMCVYIHIHTFIYTVCTYTHTCVCVCVPLNLQNNHKRLFSSLSSF